MNLESVIRPFQRPDTLARRRLVASSAKVDVNPAIISWGTSGTSASANQIDEITPGVDFKVVNFESWTEEFRYVRPTRVTQRLEDGTEVPENFVDVERPDSIGFRKDKSLSSPGPDELSARNSAQVYADTNRDSAEMQPFENLASRGILVKTKYTLKNLNGPNQPPTLIVAPESGGNL